MKRDIGFWYWTASIVLLAFGLAGWTRGFYVAIGLNFIHALHFWAREKSIKAFQVQVRIAFLFLLILFLWEPLRWLYWWPLIGLTVRVTTDYCFLARLLSLLPWNRTEPLTLQFIRRRIFSRPVKGCILDQKSDVD